MRNSIEIDFKVLPTIDYIVSFNYYINPTVNASFTAVSETAKTLRSSGFQFTIGATPADSAINYAAALAIDFPTFVTVVSGTKVTVTTPNGSPIFGHKLSTPAIRYKVKTGSSYITKFVFTSNPGEMFSTPYTITVPKLTSYDLFARFITTPIAPYDITLAGTMAATMLNMETELHAYIASAATVFNPFQYISSTAGDVSIEIDYLQKVLSRMVVSGIPADGTDITFNIMKNHAVFATITKNMSSTLNDVDNVLIGANILLTAENFVNNMKVFNHITDVEYTLVGSDTIGIRTTGGVQNLWSIVITANTTGVIALGTVTDVIEADTIQEIPIPNTIILDTVAITKTRGSELYVTSELTPFVKTEFKIYQWTGSIFSLPELPYIITHKSKITDEQDNIYININPFIKTGYKADLDSFLTTATTITFTTDPAESKWVKIEAINRLNDGDDTVDPVIPDTIVGTHEQYYYALDGYIDTLDIYENQNTDILLTGRTRFVDRGSKHCIFFKANHIVSVSYTTSADSTPVIVASSSGIPDTNDSYIRGVRVNTDLDVEWIKYAFEYDLEYYEITYFLYEACQSEGFQLVFKNRYGMLEGFPVSQRRDRRITTTGTEYLRSTVDVNGVYTITDHTRKQYNVSGSDTIIFNTDWLPEYMNAPLKELMLTEELYMVDPFGDALPVVKVADNLAFKTQQYDKLIQYTIEVRTSHDTIFNIQ